MSERATAPPPATEMPAYWFCLLESARERGDSEAAAHARRELGRLGVRVTYRRPRPARKEGRKHA